MLKIVSIAIFLLSAMLVTGCSDNTADARLKKILDVPSRSELTETVVYEKVASILAIGTPEAVLAEKVNAMGIGKDTLSSYGLVKERNMAVVRVDFDPSTFGASKESWIISLHLDSSQKLESIQVKRHLTGL